MVNRIELQKKLLQLGTLSVALMIGTVSLGCTKAVEPEETKETASTVVAAATEAATLTVDPTATASSMPTNPPAPTPTPEPTAEPSPTPYDPYTLSDEEAIEIGTYIYDNYIAKYMDNHATFFYKHSEAYQLEDIINYVCILNQKYPLYEERRSSILHGNTIYLHDMHEQILNGDIHLSVNKRVNNLFPYSIFLKEGRPERALLEELEEGFRYISDNEVSNEEIYSYWGKVFKLAIHSDETFKDWDPFQYYMFYYTIKGQYYFVLAWPEIFNNIPYDVPAKYVFDNNKNVKLKLEDAFYMRDTVRRNKYPGLTDQEFNQYVGCLEEYLDKCAIITNDREYVKQKIKSSN